MDLKQALEKITELEKQVETSTHEYKILNETKEQLTKQVEDLDALNKYLQHTNRKQTTQQPTTQPTTQPTQHTQSDNLTDFVNKFTKGEFNK